MARHNIACKPVQDRPYGLVTQVTLPGGGKLGVYQPRHARPKAMNTVKRTRANPTKKTARKAPKKPGRRG
jgi:hypothetical protein